MDKIHTRDFHPQISSTISSIKRDAQNLDIHPYTLHWDHFSIYT
jgi:hypothetical protein